VRLTRRCEEGFDEELLTFVRFVPLIGAQGWNGDDAVDPVDNHDLTNSPAEASDF
jgi:hypothetical protein